MKNWKTVLCLFLSVRSANAETTLSFAAQVEDETLAEESILLVHCLSERSGRGWQLDGEAIGPLSLRVKESGHLVSGVYTKEGKETDFTLKAGGADEICDRLEPISAPTPLKAAKPATSPEPTLGLLSAAEEDDNAPPKKAWMWAAAGLAVVGGFLFWRSRQPDFKRVEMH